MIAVALKGLSGRKLRSVLTAMAIVLGVAMISGTYVLTDTINAGFDTIFTRSYKNADVIISGKAAFQNSNGNGVQNPTFPESVLTKVKALPDVAAAAGSVTSDTLKLIGKNGKVIQNGGAPALGFSVDPREQRFNPTSLAAGSWPSGPDEIAIDKGTADKKHFNVGDPIKAQGVGPARPFRIVGIAKFAGVNSIGGATFALFDPKTAQRMFGKPGQLDLVRIQSKSGVSKSKLLSEIRPLLPATATVRDAAAQAKEDKKQVGGFLKFIQYALLAFAGIALFVGAFVIANTLSITIAQRMREFATLRTLGASRRQVLWSVVIEALVIGVIASAIGLFFGLALAKLLNSLFVAFGIDLPQGKTIFSTRTIVVSMLVGTVITLIASLRPARRATRVPPIAAVREGSVLPVSRWAKYGPVTALIVLALAIALVAVGTLDKGLGTAPRLLMIGVGVLLLFFGVSMNAAKAVPLLAAVLGAPARSVGGAPGVLARDNSTRNPARTASTASALMIGLTLVTFVAIFGAGLRASFEDAVNKLFIADYALTSSNTFNPIDATAGKTLAKQSGLLVSPIRGGSIRLLGSSEDVSGVDKNAPKVIRLDWQHGNDSVPGRLGTTGFFSDTDFAKKKHLHIGSVASAEFPTGEHVDLHLLGLYKKPKGGSPFGSVVISNTLFDKHFARPQDQMVLINLPGGVNDANTKKLKGYASGFADAKIQTRDQFKKSFEGPINKLLNLLYALLGLSVIVSLFGIVNTLVLTVFERTREIGMLRAVGMTRTQVRMMIRYEAIVTSLMGAALGIATGTFLAVLIIHALSNQGVVFKFPVRQIVYFVIAAIFVGLLAAIFPARRAARLNVLQALQYE